MVIWNLLARHRNLMPKALWRLIGPRRNCYGIANEGRVFGASGTRGKLSSANTPGKTDWDEARAAASAFSPCGALQIRRSGCFPYVIENRLAERERDSPEGVRPWADLQFGPTDHINWRLCTYLRVAGAGEQAVYPLTRPLLFSRFASGAAELPAHAHEPCPSQPTSCASLRRGQPGRRSKAIDTHQDGERNGGAFAGVEKGEHRIGGRVGANLTPDRRLRNPRLGSQPARCSAAIPRRRFCGTSTRWYNGANTSTAPMRTRYCRCPASATTIMPGDQAFAFPEAPEWPSNLSPTLQRCSFLPDAP